MIITENLLFVHLQKCAGSFIEKYLLENYTAKSLWPKHRGISSVVSKIQNRTVFGAVRNPYDWYTSWYFANKQADSTLFPEIFSADIQSFEDFILSLDSLEFNIQHDLRGDMIRKHDIGIYTYRYLKSFCIDNIEYAIEYPDGSLLLDTVLHVENINEDLADLLGLNGKQRTELIDMEPYHSSTHKPWEELYTDEMKSVVRQLDRIIFEGYYSE
jgi:hypothetical protein